MSTKRQHIIVFRLSAMGDVAMTVPVLRALTEQNPNLKVTVVSRGFFKPFFDIPNVDFFAFDAKGRHKGFGGLLKLYSDLKSLKPDAFADLHNVLRSKVITSLFKISGIKTATYDKDRKAKKALTRAENKIFKPLKSVFDKYVSVFKELGFAIDLKKSTFPPKKVLSSEVIKISGVKSEKWIGIAPFAQHQAKVYPEDLLQKVIMSLAEKGLKIFLFGSGASEIAILNRLSNNQPNVIIVAGRVSLAQELELISNLNAILSMDSANAHMAAMFGIPVITLWGATHPYSGFMPFNQPLENAITSDRTKYPKLPTSIYGNKIVEGYEDAMRSISPETIVAKIMEVIRK